MIVNFQPRRPGKNIKETVAPSIIKTPSFLVSRIATSDPGTDIVAKPNFHQSVAKLRSAIDKTTASRLSMTIAALV